MPTYEYACTQCKRNFEVVQSFSDAPLTTCEVCGGELKRVFHPVGIVLKGSGFYSTDNRSGKSLSQPGKKDEGGSSESGGGSKSGGGSSSGGGSKSGGGSSESGGGSKKEKGSASPSKDTGSS